ncbi:MAG: 30S ribosomal protein S6 [Desulfobulbus propionicus]|nr:MAG: 30S ribosomal protein S6 [Desulfobulbus propionicus]
MRHYETTYILRPNLGEEIFTEIIDRTNGIITASGGAIISLERWGIKRLAYEIKKEIQGYYVHVNYAASGEIIAEIERIFKLDDRLLRFLTIKLSDKIGEADIEAEKERIAAIAAAEEAAAQEEADAETEQQAEEEEASAPKQEQPATSDAE